MTVKEVVGFIEEFAPLGYQESYDNAGLLIGASHTEVKAVLLCVDVTAEVIDEALAKGANLIVSHHPLIFGGIKRITGANQTEKVIIKAIKHDIAIYAAHTNLDVVWGGVNIELARRIGLEQIQVLEPQQDRLVKLAVFVPESHSQVVRKAMFEAGAGQIGNYDECSFNTSGVGTFKAGDETNPFVGSKNELHHESEVKVEVVVPKPILSSVLSAMLKSHPYEEVAYDIIPLLNRNPRAGLGAVGMLSKPEAEEDFLARIKTLFNVACVKHSSLLGKPIQRVALCGGSGSELIKNAIGAKVDVFITADIKYHQFFEAENKLVIADIGHYESEQLSVDIFYELLTKKMPNFALLKSSTNTNPINYL